MAIFPWQTETWRQINAMRQSLPHALLFQGRKGVGKLQFARTLAHGLLCETPQPSGEGCGKCLACGWLAQGNHPDFRSVEPEALTETDEDKPAKGKKPSHEIKIEQIRELAGLVNLSTHRDGMRVVLIHPAEAMNSNAANALLKTLEEPPPHTLIILVTHQAQFLLPTVRSRCLKLTFAVPPTEQSMNWLRHQGLADPAPFLAQAGYAPLVALEMSMDELQEHRQGFLSQLARPQALDPIALAEKSEKLDMVNLVKWLQQWVYDLIGCRLSGLIRYQPDFAAEVRALAPHIRLHAALMLQKELLAAQRIVHHPLNTQLFLEQLLLSYMQLMNPIESDHG
ncbi:MAG: DNA polymerase III subunit delta' [Sulfurimicrobium sp.]|jgi:DNA polymerase-3 subunit delta'|nr:DNA polymerase III subunit delta' [Sulfurimicrobium sp.]